MSVKLAVVMTLAALALTTTGALAVEGDKSVEASLNYGTEAFDGLEGQIGATAGFGYEFRNHLQGRFDLSYFRSSTNSGNMDFSGTRIPIDLGVRYLYPLPEIDKNLTAFGQGALEISFDDWKSPGDMSYRSDTRFGLLIGTGADYKLDPDYSVFANLQYHIINDSYFSTGIGMAYHF
jgi:hypothetical protein